MRQVSEHTSQSAGAPVDASQEQNAQPSGSKRALLRAAWVPPVIVALNLPRSGYAANMSGTSKRGKDKEKDSGNHDDRNSGNKKSEESPGKSKKA